MKTISLGTLLLFPLLLSCTKSDQSSSSEEKESLIQSGQVVYKTGCGSCHNMDPTLEGALGPAVADSSLELLQARVVENKYPEGYTPKRKTTLMTAMPQFEKDIPALHAYLNSGK